MNTTHLRTTALALCLLAAGAARAGSSVENFVAGDVAARPCTELTALSGLDARVVAIAGQGTTPLRQFIWVTQSIYGLDMNNTVAWLDEQRSARASCVAAASSATSVASR